MQFLACVWNADTYVAGNSQPPTGLRDSDDQWKTLAQCVSQTYAACEECASQDGETYLPYVFLAPEYYFAKAANRHFIEQTDQRNILERLRALSLKYNKMLIVPGTIAWWRKAYQGRGDEERIRKATSRLVDRIKVARLGSISSMNSYNMASRLVSDMAKLKKDKEVYLAQNTAYIAYNGKILKYHKFGNFSETEGDQQDRHVVFAPGASAGRFSIGPLKFGLEICMDHTFGLLKNTAEVGDEVHVHLIVSAVVKQEAKFYGTTRGVVLHATSHPHLVPGPKVDVVGGAAKADEGKAKKWEWHGEKGKMVKKTVASMQIITLPAGLVSRPVNATDQLESIHLSEYKK
jgi:predicted amidohydrolase